MRKRASIQFTESLSGDPLSTRFGGEPYGMPHAHWPRSKSSGEALQFVCQVPIGPELFPGCVNALAYLFIGVTDGAETWVPDGGENAVVIVPKEQLTTSETVGDAPRLYRMVKKWWSARLSPTPCVYGVELTKTEDPEFIPEERLHALPDTEADAYRRSIAGNKLGGVPAFLQGDELPFGDEWHLLLQLDSTEVPFWINFGDAGIGYAFINRTGTQGKFLWQCA